MDCIPDYFDPAPTASAGVQVLSGNQTIMGDTITNGTKKTIYVTGNATIMGNITYASTSWSSEADIPSFYLIVKGNIYIDKNVTQLDGVYIAQPSDASNGILYTCTNGSTLYNSNVFSNLYTNCNQQLIINGAVIAKQTRLLRTYGSLRDATTPPGRPAEKFNFTPEVYMVNPNLPATSTTTTKYDFIASLPPVL